MTFSSIRKLQIQNFVELLAMFVSTRNFLIQTCVEFGTLFFLIENESSYAHCVEFQKIFSLARNLRIQNCVELWVIFYFVEKVLSDPDCVGLLGIFNRK
jgi:hypothetical protein